MVSFFWNSTKLKAIRGSRPHLGLLCECVMIQTRLNRWLLASIILQRKVKVRKNSFWKIFSYPLKTWSFQSEQK